MPCALGLYRAVNIISSDEITPHTLRTVPRVGLDEGNDCALFTVFHFSLRRNLHMSNSQSAHNGGIQRVRADDVVMAKLLCSRTSLQFMVRHLRSREYGF
jgi:hypothetical protein